RRDQDGAQPKAGLPSIVLCVHLHYSCSQTKEDQSGAALVFCIAVIQLSQMGLSASCQSARHRSQYIKNMVLFGAILVFPLAPRYKKHRRKTPKRSPQGSPKKLLAF